MVRVIDFTVVQSIIDNQPNGYIKHGDSPSSDPENTPFDELSCRQQCDQIIGMLECGVDIIDLQTELYLVSDLPAEQVWTLFGVQIVLDYE